MEKAPKIIHFFSVKTLKIKKQAQVVGLLCEYLESENMSTLACLFPELRAQPRAQPGTGLSPEPPNIRDRVPAHDYEARSV